MNPDLYNLYERICNCEEWEIKHLKHFSLVALKLKLCIEAADSGFTEWLSEAKAELSKLCELYNKRSSLHDDLYNYIDYEFKLLECIYQSDNTNEYNYCDSFDDAVNCYIEKFVNFFGSECEAVDCYGSIYSNAHTEMKLHLRDALYIPQLFDCLTERGESLEALAAKLDVIPDKSTANDILSDSVKLSEWKEQCLADCEELYEKSLLEIDISTRFINFWTELINDELIQSLCPPPRELTPEEFAKSFK